MYRFEYDFASNCYRDLLHLAEAVGTLPIRYRYEVMYRVLVSALRDYTERLDITFSGAFARLDYLCRQLSYREQNPKGYRQICVFRGRCTNLHKYSDHQLSLAFPVDLLALCQLLEAIYKRPVPRELQNLCAPDYPHQESHQTIGDYLRVSVRGFDAGWLYLNGVNGEEWIMPWSYQMGVGQPARDLEYLRAMVRQGTQLNLIRPWEEGGCLYAMHVIYEPDILVEISSIAHSYTQFGPSPYNYLLDRLTGSKCSSATILGNLAGQMLDEEVHAIGQQPVSYQSSLRRFFADSSLDVITCDDLQGEQQLRDFHGAARLQQQNIRNIVNRAFSNDRTINVGKVVLEPSFLCEMLGVQGRMDLMQSDKRVLIEQKSGKMDEYRHSHQIQHFVQLLLYQAMLHYAYSDPDGKRLRNDDIASYLLYSKYPDGLLKEAPAPVVLDEALMLRNKIAHLEIMLGNGEASHLFSHLTPDVFNVNGSKGVLWDKFVRPRIDQSLKVIQQADPLLQAYFYRMITFVTRENLLSKVGTSEREASGFAALWNSTSTEKREAGNLMCGLAISDISEGHDVIVLSIPESDNAILPNFRVGDVVILYSYPSQQDPDARHDLVFRASVIQLTSGSISLRLRYPQKNVSLFDSADDVCWAIEHDFIESSYSGLYQGLYMMLGATLRRRQLLLAQRKPECDTNVRLIGDYGKFNQLVLGAKQASDYFLLIGPPGTGKTSCGLVNILSEALLEGQNVLIVSFTNRAVDEICSKLVKMDLPYIRVGSELACSPEYRHNLLCHCADNNATALQIKNYIKSVRVIVGTTTSLISHRSIFQIKQFDLCIIDEASQILEPHLLALLSARNADNDAIRKFVMIGDHKQLPAVVQQKESESVVDCPELNAIGLLDCRQSLFERLLRISPDNLVYRLSAQGRMHHDVADFPNRAFYNGCLTEVPLDHQLRHIGLRSSIQSPYIGLLTRRRVSFVPVTQLEGSDVPVSSDKVNVAEAMVIADIVALVRDLYHENGKPFVPSESVGVIVPYRHQISSVRQQLERISRTDFTDVTIDTVERFQGSQRDVIIYGFTVSREYQLSFLTNNRFDEGGCIIDRKLNVAMTRARENMILVGNPALLRLDPLFARLIDELSAPDDSLAMQ